MGTVSFGKMRQKKGTGWAQEAAAPRYPGHGLGNFSATDLLLPGLRPRKARVGPSEVQGPEEAVQLWRWHHLAPQLA